jgi:hypothetical protein
VRCLGLAVPASTFHGVPFVTRSHLEAENAGVVLACLRGHAAARWAWVVVQIRLHPTAV